LPAIVAATVARRGQSGLGGFALTRGANFSALDCAVSRERQLPV